MRGRRLPTMHLNHSYTSHGADTNQTTDPLGPPIVFRQTPAVPAVSATALRAAAAAPPAEFGGDIELGVGTLPLAEHAQQLRHEHPQPRLAGAPRFWEPWVITYDELMEFGDEMRAIYAAATDPNAKAVAGREQCTFCGGAEPGKCEAYDEFNYALAQTYFDDDDVADDVPPSPRSNLTPERRSYLIRNGAMLNSYIKQLEEQAVIDALHGNAPPGLKAIDGSDGNRAWSDPAKVEKMLVAAFADDAFTKKLLGPAGVEKLAVPTRKKPGNPELWKDLQELIFRPPGKPQLVLASDPRPAKILAESLLDEEDDDLIGD